MTGLTRGALIGGPGHGKGDFDAPCGIAFDENGNMCSNFPMNKESTWMILMELKEVSTVDWIKIYRH